MANVSLLDVAILFLFTVSTFWGVQAGLVGGVLRILVLVAAIFFSFQYGKLFSEIMVAQAFLQEGWITDLASYLGLFLILLIGGGLATELLRKSIRIAGLAGVDRVGGFLFGFARAYLFWVVVFYLLSYTPLNSTVTVRNSKLVSVFEGGGKWLAQHLDFELKDGNPLPDIMPNANVTAKHPEGVVNQRKNRKPESKRKYPVNEVDRITVIRELLRYIKEHQKPAPNL